MSGPLRGDFFDSHCTSLVICDCGSRPINKSTK